MSFYRVAFKQLNLEPYIPVNVEKVTIKIWVDLQCSTSF